MNIYPEFVFDDKLISPINGYSCKRVNQQNINSFGFDDVEDLHIKYPDFPLKCKTSLENQLAALRAAPKTKSRERRFAENNKKIERYISSPNFCQSCKQPINYKIRNNMFCSRSCANSRKWSDADKQARSVIAKQSIIYMNNRAKGRAVRSEAKAKRMVEIESVCICCDKPLKIMVDNKKNRAIQLYSCDNIECIKTMRKLVSVESGKRSVAKRVKRSKDEALLYDLLSKHFVNIDSNVPIANGWDADILLHDYKFAILWNGPWHYKEMGLSNHSLKQVVNRDCIKIHEFENIGWEVIIYQDNQWTPETALIDILLRVKKYYYE